MRTNPAIALGFVNDRADGEHKHDHSVAEVASLQFVRDARTELAGALDSIGGKEYEVIGKFIGYSARHMNRATEGYILLREIRRIDCSKLLVRPAIEIMFRLRAICKQQGLIYRIAYTERKEREKWGKPAAEHLGVPLKYNEEGWKRFKEYCVEKVPECDLRDQRISLYDLAEAAGIGPYFDSHYRLYCKFTHSALDAVSGGLDPLSDPEDNQAIALCIVSAIEALLTIGASAPNIESLKEGLNNNLAGALSRSR